MSSSSTIFLVFVGAIVTVNFVRKHVVAIAAQQRKQRVHHLLVQQRIRVLQTEIA